MRLCSRMNLLRFARTGFAVRGVTFVKQTLVMVVGLAALNATAQNATQVDVQIYENTTVFPGEARFFMTARALDKNFLAANPQMGWVKLDTFAAYAVEPGGGAAPSEPKLADVCRFYLPTLATHFFTADSVECERFKADPLFKFEGVDFAVARPVAGVCAAGLSSLVRFYNEGQKRNVSGNHFYGTGTSVGIGNYLARFAGWRDEGAVMCVPVATKATARVIVAGRSDVIQGTGATAVAKGLPIAQQINVETLQTKSFVDTLGGDSDWLSRPAFDELRGKLYLIRANTVLLSCCGGSSSSPAPSPASFVTLRPTRATNNLMEIDIATGAMRYLTIGGAFTDVHFNAERRLLVLVSVGSNDAALLTWFDPLRDAVVSAAAYNGVSYDAALRYIGKPSCEYLLEQNSVSVWPDIIFYSPFLKKNTVCLTSSGVVRMLPADVSFPALKSAGQGGCVVGDTLYSAAIRLNLTSLSRLPDLQPLSFGVVTIPSQNPPDAVVCFVRGDSLHVVYSAFYANLTRGYFVVEFRDGVEVNRVGPLTALVNYFPNWPMSSSEGLPPGFLYADDASFVRRNDGNRIELWALTPQFVEVVDRVRSPPRDLLQRFSASTFQPIANVDIVVPARTLHVSTR